MRAMLKSDTATQHRGAAVMALAFAAVTIVSLAGVYSLDVAAGRVVPAIRIDALPDAAWRTQWLPGAVSAGEQQRAAADQWLHLILIFGAISAVVALVNALIGLFSHANDRRYETALRGALGAAPRRLRRDQFRDAVINALLGAGAGAPFGVGIALLLRRTWPAHVVSPSITAWLVAAAFASLAPAAGAALIISRGWRRPGWLSDVLAPEARSTSGFGADDLRMVLTGMQLACAVALTITGALVWSYAKAPQPTAASAARTYVAHVRLPTSMAARERARAIDELRRTAAHSTGVEAESIASAGALLGIGKVDKVLSNCGACIRAQMLTPLFPVETQQHAVGRNYFAAAGIDVVRGAEFTGAAGEAEGVVINQSFARLAYDDPNPIGKRLTVNGARGKEYRVIGVVADVPTRGLQSLEPDPGALARQTTQGSAPAIYFSAEFNPPAELDIVVRSTNQVKMAGLTFEPLQALFTRAAQPQRWFSRVVFLLGMLLCGAAMIGSFITSMLSVRARQAEIAVRRSVGARRRDVWILVYRTLLTNALRAAFAGVVLSVALSRVLEMFVPGLPAFNARTAAIVCGGFLLLAMGAAVLPARAALRIAPGLAE